MEMYSEAHEMLHPEKSEHDLKVVTKRMEEELHLKVNLRLSHFPNSVKRIDPRALLNNNLLLNHG